MVTADNAGELGPVCDAQAVDRLIGRLAREREKRDDYVKAETVFVALFPLAYGLLTFVFSNALWNPLGVHANALRVPGAPESWGALFIVLSAAVMWFALRGRQRGTVIACLVSALVYATFMVIVLTAEVAFPRTLGQATVYCVFALLFLNRARLAWVT